MREYLYFIQNEENIDIILYLRQLTSAGSIIFHSFYLIFKRSLPRVFKPSSGSHINFMESLYIRLFGIIAHFWLIHFQALHYGKNLVAWWKIDTIFRLKFYIKIPI